MIRDMHVLLSKWAGEQFNFFFLASEAEKGEAPPGRNATDSHSLYSDNRRYRDSPKFSGKNFLSIFLQGSGSTTGNTLVVVVCDYSDRYWAIARIE